MQNVYLSCVGPKCAFNLIKILIFKEFSNVTATGVWRRRGRGHKFLSCSRHLISQCLCSKRVSSGLSDGSRYGWVQITLSHYMAVGTLELLAKPHNRSPLNRTDNRRGTPKTRIQIRHRLCPKTSTPNSMFDIINFIPFVAVVIVAVAAVVVFDQEESFVWSFCGCLAVDLVLVLCCTFICFDIYARYS